MTGITKACERGNYCKKLMAARLQAVLKLVHGDAQPNALHAP